MISLIGSSVLEQSNEDVKSLDVFLEGIAPDPKLRLLATRHLPDQDDGGGLSEGY